MTQAILMLSQVVLLPLQLRLWGQAATAGWYAALAIATITYVVDCGLRTAGHTELLKANADSTLVEEASQFLQVWSWIRILVLVVTSSLIVFDIALNRLTHSGEYASWRIALIVACALETLLSIRIGYLDSLGLYRGAEASYFAFAVLRLALAMPALWFLHWTARELAWIYLCTSVAALLLQGYFLCRSIPLLQLTARFPRLRWDVLALARHTIAEPLANWVRLSLPVLVLGHIAVPMAVTTYVALRAVFGAGRTTIQQLARVASVEVIKSRAEGREERAESLLTLFVVAAVLFGFCVASLVVTDNLRILGLWLRHPDPVLFRHIALAFSLTAPFFSYQIPMNLMFRTGWLAWVARRHYAFAVYSAAFAGCCLLVKSTPVYLGCLVAAEILLSVTFFIPGKEKTPLSGTHSGSAAMQAAALGSILIISLWKVSGPGVVGFFGQSTVVALLESALVWMVAATLFAAFAYLRHGRLIGSVRSREKLDPVLAVAK